MDEIMDTSRMRRSRKMEEKIKELENEIKLLRVNTMEVLEKSLGTVGTVESIESHEDYLKAYAPVYSRLCKYITFYSNINGELELLLVDKEKAKFNININPGSKSEGFQESDSLDLKENFKDFRAIAILRNSEKVEEFPSNFQNDSDQRNNEVNQIDENNSNLNDFSPVLENNNNNNNNNNNSNNNYLSSETEDINNVSQVNMDKNYHSIFVNTGINPEDVFQFNRTTMPQNLDCPPMPFTDTTFWLRRSFSQYLNYSNFPGFSSKVCPPGFSNISFSPRLLESTENEKLNVKEENPGSETTYKKNLKPFNIDGKIGSFHDVYLTNLISPDEFYAQVRNVDLNVQMSKMMEEINKFAGSCSKKNKNYHDKSLSFRDKKYLASIEFKGGYALGYSRDQWSRLEILDWRLQVEDDFVNVFYLDNGRRELMSLENLQPMDEDFLKYPLLVQKFYLPFILPSGKEWSQKDITIFEILTEAADVKSHLKVEITENDPNRKDFALGVNLIIPESRIIVNEKLVEHGVAILNPKKNCTTSDN